MCNFLVASASLSFPFCVSWPFGLENLFASSCRCSSMKAQNSTKLSQYMALQLCYANVRNVGKYLRGVFVASVSSDIKNHPVPWSQLLVSGIKCPFFSDRESTWQLWHVLGTATCTSSRFCVWVPTISSVQTFIYLCNDLAIREIPKPASSIHWKRRGFVLAWQCSLQPLGCTWVLSTGSELQFFRPHYVLEKFPVHREELGNPYLEWCQSCLNFVRTCTTGLFVLHENAIMVSSYTKESTYFTGADNTFLVSLEPGRGIVKYKLHSVSAFNKIATILSRHSSGTCYLRTDNITTFVSMELAGCVVKLKLHLGGPAECNIQSEDCFFASILVNIDLQNAEFMVKT